MADINHHIAPLIPAATHANSAPSPRPPFVDLLFPFLAHNAVGTGCTATHTHQTISTRAYSDTRCLPPGAVPRRRPIISADVDVALSMPVSVPVHLINRSKSQVSSSRLSRCHHGACRRQPHSRPLAVVSCLVSIDQALPRWLLLTPHRRPDTAKDNLSPSPRRLRHGLGRVWKQAVLPHRMWVIRPQTPLRGPTAYNSQTAQLHIETPGTHLGPPFKPGLSSTSQRKSQQVASSGLSLSFRLVVLSILTIRRYVHLAGVTFMRHLIGPTAPPERRKEGACASRFVA